MTPPNRAAFRAAFLRRIHNLNRSLEQLARLGRGTLDAETLAAVWEAQRLLYSVAPPNVVE